MMTAGMLDREIAIEKKSVTADPTYGTEVITWVPLVALAGQPTVPERWRAQVQDALPSRSESVLNRDIAVALNLVRVRLRFRTDIDSSMRVRVYGDGADRMLKIVGGPAAVDGRKQFIELMCEESSVP